ncbi:MAG TPA: hypothetical protein VF981_05160 [Gemmatimonadaceae bacterium]
MATPTPSSAPRADVKVRALVGEYLDEKQREHSREVEAQKQPVRRSPVLTFFAFIVCVAVWILPSFVKPPDVAPSPARIEASARMTIFLAAQRVVAYQRANGRLPLDLSQAGADSTGLTYWRSTDSLFEIRAMAGGEQLAYKSSMNPALFLGNTFQVLGSSQ